MFLFLLVCIFLKPSWTLSFKMPYKFVALDLDGTTLSSQHTLSAKTISVLRRLSAKGLNISIATGRSALSVYDHITALDLPRDMNIICYNGAVCLKVPKNGAPPQTLFSRTIPPQAAKILYSLAEELKLVFQYYNGVSGEIYAVPTTEKHLELLRRYETLSGTRQIRLSSFQEAENKCEAAKIVLLTDNVDQLIEVAKLRLPDNLFNIIRGSPDPFFVEFLPSYVSKGEALVKMLELTNIIALSEVIAFGDGDNDKEFLEVSGLGVAMKNARPSLKSVANVILEVKTYCL